MIIRVENPNLFVGLTLEAAQVRIAEYGYESLLVHCDNWTATIRKDYDPLRIQLSVEKGFVTKAEIG